MDIVWTSSGTTRLIEYQDQLLSILVRQKLFSGKKIHTKYLKIYEAIVAIAEVHVDFSFMDSDLVSNQIATCVCT